MSTIESSPTSLSSYNGSTVSLPYVKPIRLGLLTKPDDRTDSIAEVKYDGFRAQAYIENGVAKLVSRKRNVYKQFGDLCEELSGLPIENAILDGEVVSIDEAGRPQFYNLLRRWGTFVYYAFDLVYLNGVDLRADPLLTRKDRLRKIIPADPGARVRYAEHIEGDGTILLFSVICGQDLEGIVVKRKDSRYVDKTWMKLKNPKYPLETARRRLLNKT